MFIVEQAVNEGWKEKMHAKSHKCVLSFGQRDRKNAHRVLNARLDDSWSIITKAQKKIKERVNKSELMLLIYKESKGDPNLRKSHV